MIKTIATDTYKIRFNTLTGMEITTGINGHEDPWILELPNMLDVGIMGNCPNRCAFCYQGDNQEPHMKLSDYKKLIWNVKDHVNQVALGGRGNPSEHPDFREILAFSRQCGVVVNYTDAGNNMTIEKATLSRETGAVAISMYFQDYTFNALKMLMDAGVKTNIHWVLSTETFPVIMDLLKNKKDVFQGRVDMNRLNGIVFLNFKNTGRGSAHPEWLVPDDSIKEFAMAMRNHKGPWKIGLDSCLVGAIEKTVGLTKQEQTMTDVCEASRFSTYITNDYRLLPCSFGKTLEKGVDLNTHTVQEAWNSPLFNKFRDKLKNEPYICPWRNW